MSQQSPTKKRSIEEVKEAHEEQLMGIEGVQGVGIGQRPEADGLEIKVYVSNKTKSLQDRIPKQVEGYPVQIEVSGEFHAL